MVSALFHFLEGAFSTILRITIYFDVFTPIYAPVSHLLFVFALFYSVLFFRLFLKSSDSSMVCIWQKYSHLSAFQRFILGQNWHFRPKARPLQSLEHTCARQHSYLNY
jgi:hypothetical protein